MWLAEQYLNEFRKHPKMHVYIFVEIVWNDHTIQISESQAYKARAKAMKMIEGKHVEHYNLLKYIDELKKLNHRSIVELQTEPSTLLDGKPLFRRIYVCLGGLTEGFKYCRPIIGVDGTFLKSTNGGILLTAVGIDSNNSMYPIAYAVVEGEHMTIGYGF